MPSALIVGARGLGRELAAHFADAGWKVTTVARTQGDLRADLHDKASLEKLPEADLAVCAASTGAPFRVGPVLEASGADLQTRLVSVVGALHFLQAVRAKTLVVIGTTLAKEPRPGFGALSAHQFALRALCAAAAQEQKARGVHVAYLAAEGQLATLSSKEWMERHGESRAIPPQEVARAIEYLHAQDARAWTHELALRPAAS